ncbi:hypothetical protein Salat_2738400 [Sesamum alatum]|uniref:Uncharacterized protein n=1 Tax=Sesamum alatum TaxID=300844 RepID=A0AAE1XK35_9LAMI|nr:hypothetical protein Salat_2738400 [Sesamum alatum]
MGNGYDHHYSIHQHQFHQKTKFLPMFCRLSIKDVKLSTQYKDPTSADEPSSPTVSCVGQVKRNNRVIGFPATNTTTTSAAANHHHKHTKLKKLFSGKTLLPNTTTINASTTATAAGRRSSGSRSCRTSREMCVNSSRRRSRLKTYCDQSGDQDCAKVVDISEMDPPLPVVKRVAPPGAGRDEVNIWKRRVNGVELKSLKIEQIHLPNSKFEPPPPTTV